MTRIELTKQIVSMKMVGKQAAAWFEQSWWGVVRQAMVEGLICYGPDLGHGVTLVRVDQWLQGQVIISEQVAQQILLRRYLRAYGPATLQDFSKWSSISMNEVRKIQKSLQEELLEVTFEDQKGLIHREDYDPLKNSNLENQMVRLLSHFDPFLLGHVDKNHLVDSLNYKRVYRKAGWISPVIMLNGRVIGIWSYTRRGKRLILEFKPFEKFSKTIRVKIEKEAVSLGVFLESLPEIRWKE